MQSNVHIPRNVSDKEEAGAFSPSPTPAITSACVKNMYLCISIYYLY